MLLVYQLKQMLPGVSVAAGAALLVLSVFIGYPLFTVYDQAGRTLQHQVGTVTAINQRAVTRGNTDPSALISVQVGDKQAQINTYIPLHVGQTLSVDYKIGKSGMLYVDRFVPMAAGASPGRR